MELGAGDREQFAIGNWQSAIHENSRNEGLKKRENGLSERRKDLSNW